MNNKPIEHSYLIKILLVGDDNCGKSSFILRYCDDVYTDNFISTIGVDFKNKYLHLDDLICKLQVWDPMVSRFRYNQRIPYRGSHGILIFFDLTKRDSFENSKKWFQEAIRYSREDIHITLVGSKLDIVELDNSRREVSYDEAKEFATTLDIDYIECSNKYNININQCIESLFKRIYYTLKEDAPSPIIIKKQKQKLQSCIIN